MKKICGTIVLMFLLSSCASYYANRHFNKNNADYVMTFQHDGVGEMSPVLLIIKTFERTYDLYDTGSGGGELGLITERGDTMILLPEYKYSSAPPEYRDGSVIRAISDEEKENIISNVFLRQPKKMIDITNYHTDDSIVNAYLKTIGDDILYKFKLKE